jgi:hypothetical protein
LWTKVENEPNDGGDDAADSTTLFVGDSGCGKSTLIQSFLKPNGTKVCSPVMLQRVLAPSTDSFYVTTLNRSQSQHLHWITILLVVRPPQPRQDLKLLRTYGSLEETFPNRNC